MIEIVILVVFFGGLIIGSAVASSLGRLPNAEQLAEQDQRRWARIKQEI